MWMIWQKQRELEEKNRNGEKPDKEMGRKITQRELNSTSKRSATKGTLICIFMCSAFLLGLGIALLCTGFLEPTFKDNTMPWLVTGSTCVVLGILVFLLSIEIIIKLRKISSSDNDDIKEKGWDNKNVDKVMPPVQSVGSTVIPVVVQPPTPVVLDPADLDP